MRFQFEMWRLFVSVSLFAIACGLFHIAWEYVTEDHNIGLISAMLGLTALCCFVAAIGVLFKKAWESILLMFTVFDWLRNLVVVLVILGALLCMAYGIVFRGH